MIQMAIDRECVSPRPLVRLQISRPSTPNVREHKALSAAAAGARRAGQRVGPAITRHARCASA